MSDDSHAHYDGREVAFLQLTLGYRIRTIRQSLETDPRSARNQDRRACLTQALKQLELAKAELERCPEGARLALLLAGAEQLIGLPDGDHGRRQYEGALRGAATTKAHRQASAVPLHARIRERAATLSPTLSATAKATLLRLQFPLSVRQLRRIIQK